MSPEQGGLHSLVAKHGQFVACQPLNTVRSFSTTQQHVTTPGLDSSFFFLLHITLWSSTDAGQAFDHGVWKNSPESKDSAADDDDVQVG